MLKKLRDFVREEDTFAPINGGSNLPAHILYYQSHDTSDGKRWLFNTSQSIPYS